MTTCFECENLTRTFESKATKYLAARSAVLYRISTKFAARKQVDMERARNDMEEHRLASHLLAKVTVPALAPAGIV